MQEAGDHLLFVEPGMARKIQHVDPVEFVIRAGLDQLLDGLGDRRIGGLLQHGNLGLDVVHWETSGHITNGSNRLLRRLLQTRL